MVRQSQNDGHGIFGRSDIRRISPQTEHVSVVADRLQAGLQ